MDPLATRVVAGDLRALARAATIVENRTSGAEHLLRELFPHTGRALTIGVTGSPGAGKSTFVDQLASVIRSENKTIGIIAVDPTSPYSGGAILGDRIRMQRHHEDSGVFIRSMATRGWMGGLARATIEMAMLFDAAGRDVVIVETVGVGQDEVEIARLADVTLVLVVPGMGDDVQAIKAGIMEIADVFVINKADLPGVEKLERDLKSNLTLAHRPDGWIPPIVKATATEGQGIDAALAAARKYMAAGLGQLRAQENWALRLRDLLRDRLLDRLPQAALNDAAAKVARREIDPYTSVNDLLNIIQEQKT
jgi:LAO/AO transport system kinase